MGFSFGWIPPLSRYLLRLDTSKWYPLRQHISYSNISLLATYFFRQQISSSNMMFSHSSEPIKQFPLLWTDCCFFGCLSYHCGKLANVLILSLQELACNSIPCVLDTETPVERGKAGSHEPPLFPLPYHILAFFFSGSHEPPLFPLPYHHIWLFRAKLLFKWYI